METLATLHFWNRLLRWLWIVSIPFVCCGLVTFYTTTRTAHSVIPAEDIPSMATANHATALPANMTWETVKSGNEGWNFDLFTPPVITLSGEKLRAFDRAAYFGPQISLALLAIEQIPYRLQLEGYANLDGSHCRVFIRQLDNQKLHTGEQGAHFPGAQFEIRDCQLQNQFIDGIHQRYPQVVVFDHRLNQEVILSAKGKTYTAEYAIHFEISEENNGIFRPIFHRVGEKLTVGSRHYELLKIDPNARTITLRQSHLDGTNATVETYRLQNPSQINP